MKLMRVATIARSPLSLGHEYVGNEGKGKMLHLKEWALRSFGHHAGKVNLKMPPYRTTIFIIKVCQL
jgi:hypothetical protein